ncbi:MAG: TIGR01777 family protein [Bacteroidetes bacterium]|nr:MAG: TIGR01777 family protein [Bacteroidota bacterium]
MKHILITGGSGLVGSALTSFLTQKGYTVSHLGRRENLNGPVKTYRWDYKTDEIDVRAFDGVDVVINLAGASVAGGRWTSAYKKEIYDSRVLSTRLLYETIKNNKLAVKKVISASATGYYGDSLSLVDESTPPSKDFLSQVCADWENEAQKIESLGTSLTILRIGIVLSPNGGFVPEMAKPIKMGFGTVLGNGKQQISWIHIDDLCGIVLKAITEEGFTGPYNCVTPNPTTNAQATKLFAKLLGKPLWLPNAPAFALKIILGGMSYELLVNHNVSAKKVADAGYKFIYTDFETALKAALTNS